MISVNYLLFTRPQFLELNCQIIKKISNENKKQIKINFLATDHSLCQIDGKIKGYIKEIEDSGIKTSFQSIPLHNNYLNKIRIGIADGYEYCIKWDEDCFVSHHIWNYLIENIDTLMQDGLFVTVPLSTGIPSTDIFIKNIFDEEEQREVRNLFKETHMPIIWGFDYRSLNNQTIFSDEWNPDKYYEALSKLNYYYSGIHPVRLNYHAQKYIIETSLKHVDKIFNKSNFYLTEMNAPYFCNSFFAIKTQDWKHILDTPSLFVDAFDEVAINRYWKQTNQRGIYINGSGAIHLFYNTINHYGYDFVNNCQEVYDKLKEKYNELF